MPARFRIEASTTTNTYVYCRGVARRTLAVAEHEKRGSFYFCMAAAAFAAFTVEGYLNHVGALRISTWRVREKELSVRAKLTLLRETMNWSFDERKKPFRSLRALLTVRNALAHGKTETIARDVVFNRHPNDDEGYPEPDWKLLCGLEATKRLVEDAEAMIQNLHNQSGFQGDAFETSGHASRTVSFAGS